MQGRRDLRGGECGLNREDNVNSSPGPDVEESEMGGALTKTGEKCSGGRGEAGATGAAVPETCVR